MRQYRSRLLATMTLALALMLLLAGVAFGAERWNDITEQTWNTVYKITSAQADAIADGYPDGSFRPDSPVTRGQFAKFSVVGLGLSTASPATPTFKDVAKSHRFFIYVEGAAKAKLIGGYTDGTFRPDKEISRQQANSMLGRYLSDAEKLARATSAA